MSSATSFKFEVDVNTIVISIVVAVLLCYFLFTSISTKPSKSNKDESKSLLNEQSKSVAVKDNNQAINAATFTEFHILEIFDISYNTKLFRFEIPFGKPLGLPIGRHLSVRAEIDGTKVTRAYTPTSKPDQKGFDICHSINRLCIPF